MKVLDLSDNYLYDLPQQLFASIMDLRIVDLSHNYIQILPDAVFLNQGLES